MRAGFAIVVAVTAGLFGSGCVDRTPDQDLRITRAVPVAKLSADLLWKDYQTNPEQADRTYRLQAIEVTGTVTKVGTDAPGDRYVFFGQPADAGVRANLLDERAAGILANIPENGRLTLLCMCDGFSGNVTLKSCITR